MKPYQLIGLTGSIILLITAFIPLAEMNNEVITIMPVYDNSTVGDNLWIWKDIAAFAVTFIITILLNFFFIVKKMRIGILISTSLNLAAVVFIYVAFWLTQLKAEEFTELTISYNLNGFILIIGFAMLYYCAAKTPKKIKG